MSEKAHVTSIEALDRFRSSLILFLERTNGVLDEVSEEVKRTRNWLQSEQKMLLAQEMKRKNRELEMLEQELYTARLSNLREAKTGQQMQINNKRREIREIEDKMRAVSGWLRNFDSTVETEARKVEKLRHLLDGDLVKGVGVLSKSIRLLAEYSAGPGMPDAARKGTATSEGATAAAEGGGGSPPPESGAEDASKEAEPEGGAKWD